MEDLANELLGGQKLQGALTANEVYAILDLNGWKKDFPLFCTVYGVINREIPVESVTAFMQAKYSSSQDSLDG